MSTELLCGPADVVDVWPQFARLGDTRQTSLIARASEKVIGYCRRPGFAQTSYVETHNGANRPWLWLRQRPVLAVSAVTVNTEPLDNTFGDAWSFVPETGKLIRGNGQDDPRFAPWFTV